MGESVAKSTKRVFYGWYIVAVAILIGFLTTGLSGYANGILLPQLADTLADGKRGPISIGISLTTITVALISPFVGRVADRGSPKRLMLIGVTLIALAYLAIATANSLWQFFLAKGVLFGVGITLAGPLVRNLLVAHWFDSMLGRALGFSVLGASLAGIVLPLILNELVNSIGWRETVLVFSAVVSIVLIPTVHFFIVDKPEQIGETRDGNSSLTASERPEDKHLEPLDEKAWTYIELAKTKAFWATGLIFGPMMCVYVAIMVHLFGHATNEGLSTEQAALVLSMVATTSLIGKPLLGALADYSGARLTLWVSLGCQGLALILFTISTELWHFLLAAVIHGFGFSALSAMRTYVLSINIGKRSLGTALGLLKWIEFPFMVTASPIAGFVYDATGSYNSAFLVFASLIGLGCIGPFFIRNRRE